SAAAAGHEFEAEPTLVALLGVGPAAARTQLGDQLADRSELGRGDARADEADGRVGADARAEREVLAIAQLPTELLRAQLGAALHDPGIEHHRTHGPALDVASVVDQRRRVALLGRVGLSARKDLQRRGHGPAR